MQTQSQRLIIIASSLFATLIGLGACSAQKQTQWQGAGGLTRTSEIQNAISSWSDYGVESSADNQHHLWNDDLDRAECGHQECGHQECGHQECGHEFSMEHERKFRLTEFNIYPTFSYLSDQVGNYTEFEFASETQLGNWQMENRTVLNVADLPGTIKLGPTNPGGNSTSTNVRASGFGDVLSGFFFSRKPADGQQHRKTHLGIGTVITLPTASDGLLGSGQTTIGPGAHFSTEVGRLTTGFFIWQSWGMTDNPAKKRVNQLFGKPFLIYELTEKWNLVYIPLGMSHSWKANSGEDWTVPIGGGVRRLFHIGDQKMGLQFQAFDYVARKPKDPEWELRFTIEFLFD